VVDDRDNRDWHDVRLHKEAMAEEAVVVEREGSPCLSPPCLLSLGLLLSGDCGLTCCISC